MDKPIRVLHVMSTLERGGAEQVVMNWYRNIDRSRVQFDFAVEDRYGEHYHEAEIRDLGGRVFRVPTPRMHLLPYLRAWWELFARQPELRIVHAHHTSPAVFYLGIARSFGRITIAHSHTAGGGKTGRAYIKGIARRPLRHIAHHLWGCSREANTWMFGTRADNLIIPNAISAQDFSYDASTRTDLRERLGLTDLVVIGHIGNFTPPKNHFRILQIFREYKKTEPRAHLLLVGDGPLRTDIETRIHELGIQEAVSLTGTRSDTSDLLAAMDVFLFPSFFEGFPVAVLEAQASGLNCVISNSVTSEVVLSNKVSQISLDEPDSLWAATLHKISDVNDRKLAYRHIQTTDYEVSSAAKKIQEAYFDMLELPHVDM